MADKITNDITLLFKTKLDEKSKQEIGKNLKSLLENAAIGFDEAETKRNLEPIIRMMKRLFDKAEIAFDADQLLAMPSRQALQKMAEMEVGQLQMAFDKALAKSGGIKVDLGDMDLSAMTEPLEKLTQELSEIGERVASTTKKSVREIENSINGLSRLKPKKTTIKVLDEKGVEQEVIKEVSQVEQTIGNIEKTLGAVNNPKHYTSAKKATAQLESARAKYAKSVVDDDPWEIQYQHLLTFVARYEAMTKKIKPLVDTSNPEFKQLYEMLSPKAGAAKISLEHFVDIAQGNELREYKNQPWARENTLKKIEQTLRSGITVKDGPNDGQNSNAGNDDSTPHWDVDDGGGKENKSPRTKVPIAETPDVDEEEKARIEAEKKAQAEKAAAEAAKKRRIEEEKIAKAVKKEIKVYRGIIPPEDEASSRREVLDSVDGAEWWTNKKDVAQTYADQDVGGTILVGTITPKNPLVIDAGKHNFDEFAKMPGIIANLDKFPELMSKISAGEGINDTQKYINDVARELGHDVVEFINVNDVMNPKEYVEIGTSYAVLNDSILQLVGALSQKSYDLKEEIGEYEKKPNMAAVPEYYFPPEDEQSAAAVDVTNDGLVKEATLLEKIQKLTTYIDNEYLSTGKHLSDFLDDVQRESNELDSELKEILTTLNLIDGKGNLTFDVKRNGEEGGGTTHNGALISDDFVLIERGDYEKVKDSRLPDNTQRAAKDGVNVAEVLGYLPSKHTNGFFDVQGTARGQNLFDNGVLSQDVVNATEDQLEQLVQAFIKARDYGFNIENGGNNIVYDKEKGFSFYDLEELSVDDTEFWNSKTEAEKKLYALEDLFSLFSGLNREHTNFADDANVGDFAERIKGIIETKGIVNPDAVDAMGRNYEDIYDDVFSGNIDEEYDDIVALLQAEANAHKENEATIVAETQAQEALNDAKAEAQQIDVKEDAATTVGKPVTTVGSVDGVGTKGSIQTEELRQLLNSITYNVKVVQDAEPTEDNKISIDEAALENVLNRITYNVKIAHDDADKTANKIAIDEGALEQTLNRVFASVLNPEVEQTESEPKNEPWALEKTLLSVKEVLDGIRTNTAKVESVEIAPASTEVGNVLATENTLAAIKNVVETINSKIANGTKIETGSTNGGANKRTGTSNPYDISERIKTQRVQLAKLTTQLVTSGRLTDNIGIQISKLLSELDEVENGPDLSKWAQRFTQLKATINIDDMLNKVVDDSEKDAYKELLNYQKTRNQLELQYTKAADGSQLKAFYKEQLDVIDDLISTQLILNENEEYAKKLAEDRAKQEIKLGAERAKQTDREAKIAKKEMQKQAMLGKAGNAVGRAQGVYIEAEGLDPKKLPKSFTQKGGVLDSYYSAFEKLRQKQTELSKLDIISDEQKKDLRDQINNVNQMTSEIGELVSQYQRLSGDNVKELGVNTLRPNAGLKEYEAELKRLASASANGKIQIKSFDNETKTLTYTVKNAKREVTTYTATLRGLDNQFVTVAGSTKRAESFLEATKRKMSEISSYMSGMAVFSRIGQELRRGIQYIREIDLALTELKKVTDETEETYDKFLDTAAKTGARLGTTISAVTDATATFAKLGYSMKQATEMAEAAIVYKNVGDNIESTGDAADSIISTMKGFRLEASESMAIVDRFNEVGNRFAITSQGIGEALRLSASALSEGGNSLDESIGLITAANEVVNDPSSVGTALKTLTLRLRGSKTELEEMGEDVSDMATTTSQLQAKLLALTGGQADIMLDANTFKNSTQILREMADAWEDMTDIQRASALELMGGKRQANVLSALIQNFDTVESVIKTSANSAGSALKENERYLDSIQGKIDQFNNAVQAMWSEALNSNFVKWVIEVGTGLIKILDTLKPISLLIAGIAVYLNKKYNFVDFSKLLIGFKEAFSNSKGPKDFFKNLIHGFKNTEISIEKAQEKLKELEEQKVKLGDPKSEKNRRKVDALDQEINKYKEMLAPSEELIAAQNRLQKAQNRLANTKSTNPKTIQKYQREVNKAKLEVDNLTFAQKKSGKTGQGAFTGLGKSVKAFGKQVASVVTQMLVMLVITKAIELVTQAVDDMITTAKEAAEAYEELNDELDTLKNNIEDISDEISTLDDKMAELIAKDSLTLTEKEELERLRAEREELERTLELNKQLANQKQQQVNNQTSDQVEYYKNKGVKSGKTTAENVGSAADTAALAGGAATAAAAMAAFGGSMSWNAVGWIALAAAGITAIVAGVAYAVAEGEEKIGESIDNMEAKLAEKEEEVRKAREKYQQSGNDSDREKYEEAQKALSDYRGEMAQYFTELDAMYQNVDLSTIEDPDEYKRLKEEMNDFYNERDKWLIKSGAEGAESNAIERIFSKDDYESASDTIDNLVEKLKKDPTDQNVLKQISTQCKIAEADLEAVGLSVQDAIDYFTMLGQNAAFDTIEGKTAEITSATLKLQTLLSNTKSADFTGLFGQGGEVNTVAIAEYFKGTSEATRTEIARLVKNINDGEISVKQALASFAAYGVVESWKIIEAEVSELNTNVFADLGDEISGVINTVKELSSAFESVASSIELVDKAQAEMAYSGHLSVETALQLMESTDDWNQVLKVEEGNIKLVDGAEQVLVQTKLDLIKKNLQTALSTVEAQLAQISATEASADMAYTIEESTNLAVTELAANMAFAAKMAEAYTRAMNGEKINMATYMQEAEAAKQNVRDRTNYQKNTAERIGREDLEKEKARLEAMLGMYETVDTPSEFRSNYPSDEVSGGNADKKSAEEDKMTDDWEKLLAKYENLLALLSNERDLIEAEIDKAEARGGKASANYYADLIANSNAEKKLLEQKKVALEQYLAANAGAIDQDTWTEYNNEINETAVAIKECEVNTIEWAEAIRDIDLHYFEQITNEVSRLGEELDFVNSLLEDEEVADENGNWSSAALTRMGLYTQQMEKAATEAAMYQDEIDKINEEYEAGALSEEQYQEKLSDLVNGQQDAIQSYEDAKDSIVEMNEARIDAIREGIEKEIEAYEDLIDVKKEELDAERDLHDFREDIKDQTKDIASLERRIAALSGSSAASDVAERRKLEAQLLEAKEGLNDTYYGHSRDAQSAALDEEAEAYTLSKERYIEQLEEQLKDTETLIQNSIMDVMLNADTVYTELNELADLYGVDLSDSLTLPWKNASAQAIKWKDELKASMTSGEYASLIGEGGAITGFANGVATKLKGSWTTAQTAAKNYAGYLTGAELKNRFTNTLTGFGTQIQNIIDKWNGVKRAADDAYAAQTRKVTVGGTSTGDGDNNNANNNNNNNNNNVKKETPKTVSATAYLKIGNTVYSATGSGTSSSLARTAATGNVVQKAYNAYRAMGYDDSWLDKRYSTWKSNVTFTKPKVTVKSNANTRQNLMYAKGTMGTTRDQWAITDEPQFGDELVLVPGKDGNLSFMRKGTGVVPADLTQKLFELAQIPTSDLMNKNLTAIVPNITKNDFKNEFNFESLVHVDTVDSDTLPKLEKMVDKKIDDFSKALNYSLKKFAR